MNDQPETDEPTAGIERASLDDLLGEAPAGPPRRRRGRGVWIVAGSFGALLVAVVAVYLVDLALTSGRIERNTTIAGMDVGGLTPAEATVALQRSLDPQFETAVTLRAHGVDVPLVPAQAGLHADIPGAVAAAGTRSAGPAAVLSSFFRHRDVPLAVVVDEPTLRDWAVATARTTDVRPVEGAVAINGVAVETTTPVTGMALDVDGTVRDVAAAFSAGGPKALSGLELPVTSSPVRASAAGVTAARDKLETLLGGPITIVAGAQSFSVPPAQIAAAVTVGPDAAGGFSVTVDAAKLRAPFTAAIEQTQGAPKDATIAIKDGKPVVTPSVSGRTVDWAATDAALGRAAGSADRRVPVAYRTTEPNLTTDKANALGVREVIGEFTTGGFAYASGINIKVVAAKVDGALVLPGKTFSLNGFTGPRTEAQGYVPAGVINDGHADTAVGGGISQFATTLYNAAYFAGMGDVTHTPHSYYISRYPAGREATVYDGLIDLAFSNDYPTAVLIQTVWNPENITVRMWGTKHVEVESLSSDRFNFTAPPRREIPYGTACTPSSGTQGFSIVNTRVIRDLAGKEIRREKFTTVYNGQQQVVCLSAPAPPPQTDPPAGDTPTVPGRDPVGGPPSVSPPAPPPDR